MEMLRILRVPVLAVGTLMVALLMGSPTMAHNWIRVTDGRTPANGLESNQNYTYCHFSDGSSLLVALTLKVLLSRLPTDALIRVHRKHFLRLI
jgi:hypothetical protein